MPKCIPKNHSTPQRFVNKGIEVFMPKKNIKKAYQNDRLFSK
jgi:hypothetical protein